MRKLITALTVTGALMLGTATLSYADEVHYYFNDFGDLERKVVIDNNDPDRQVYLHNYQDVEERVIIRDKRDVDLQLDEDVRLELDL